MSQAEFKEKSKMRNKVGVKMDAYSGMDGVVLHTDTGIITCILTETSACSGTKRSQIKQKPEPYQNQKETHNQRSNSKATPPPQKQTATKAINQHKSDQKIHKLIQSMSPSEASLESTDLPTIKRPAPIHTFPCKLYHMLTMCEAEGNDHVVSWLPDGTSFHVHKIDLFLRKILPKHFKQTQYRSFQRQLNIYGFQRLAKGSYMGSYSHPLFKKGDPKSVETITRTNYGSKTHRKIHAVPTAESTAATTSEEPKDSTQQETATQPKQQEQSQESLLSSLTCSTSSTVPPPPTLSLQSSVSLTLRKDSSQKFLDTDLGTTDFIDDISRSMFDVRERPDYDSNSISIFGDKRFCLLESGTRNSRIDHNRFSLIGNTNITKEVLDNMFQSVSYE